MARQIGTRCKIEGCTREVWYLRDGVCQTHYCRFRRYGTYELTKSGKAKPRIEHSDGYQLINVKDHPLLTKGQIYVYEHRYLIYEKYGENLPPCELCGKLLDWSNCHIDHVDENVKNNDINNLRPLCRICNTRRNPKLRQHEYKNHYAISFAGETKTPAEWARDQRVVVSIATIIRRKIKGMSDTDALFSPKITHNGKNKRRI